MKAHLKFNSKRDWKNLDMRAHPEEYQIGVGEQGVLSVEPYKSEILPHWRFATPDKAHESSAKIYELFCSIKRRTISLAWTWRASFCKWESPARGVRQPQGGKKYDGPVPA
jgi:hypothetical protein